jgi:signal transduction histidine kinase
MLEVSRLEETVFSGETDINKLTLDVLEVYEYMIQDKEIELVVSQGKEQKVKIPERALQKIISNLIGNSVKYSPPKKKISILSNNHVWQISNHVNHIEKMDLKSIADPFISYDVEEEEYAKSHGLGLYIVVSLLEQYQYPYHFDLDNKTKEFVFQIKMK